MSFLSELDIDSWISKNDHSSILGYRHNFLTTEYYSSKL